MLVSLGDAVVDLVALNLTRLPQWGEDRVVSSIELHLGGSAVHVATNLAALGNAVALMAGVGEDEWGRFLSAGASSAGVDTRGLRRLQVPSAVTMVLSGAEDRAFVSSYGATARFSPRDLDQSLLREATHLHISGLWQSPALQPHLAGITGSLRARGVTVSLDTGNDATAEWRGPLPELLGEIDLLFPNEIEAMGITGENSPEAALDALAERVPLVALKLGAQGAHVARGKERWQAPAFPVNIVDTTGTGDAFNAGFLHGWLQGWPMDQSLRFATATGALAVARVGASEGPPAEDEVRRFIGGSAGRLTPESEDR